MIAVESVRLSQAINVEGAYDTFVSIKNPRHAHLKMFYLDSSVLRIECRETTLYVPMSNIGSFHELVEKSVVFADDRKAAPQPGAFDCGASDSVADNELTLPPKRGRGRPRKE